VVAKKKDFRVLGFKNKSEVGGGGEGKKETIQVDMPRKVAENLPLESKHG